MINLNKMIEEVARTYKTPRKNLRAIVVCTTDNKGVATGTLYIQRWNGTRDTPLPECGGETLTWRPGGSLLQGGTLNTPQEEWGTLKMEQLHYTGGVKVKAYKKRGLLWRLFGV